MEIKYLNLKAAPLAVSEINYEQSNIGDNPVVNLATGRLQFFSGDCSVGVGNFGINVAHVYNSKLNSSFASKFACFGKNWKLNLSQYMLVGSSSKQYIDETGEIHSFVTLDSDRMYEENNAKITLQSVSGGYVISDGAGNKKYFNSNGYLCKSVSCHNSAMVKVYKYDANNRLVSVYDERTLKNGSAKSRIELTYNSSGYLNSMTAYANFTEKVSGYKYAYDSSGNLVAIYRVAYNAKSQEMLSKQIAEFCYENNLLSMIINSENNAAQMFKYTNGKVSRVSTGVVQNGNIAAGMKDSAGKSLSIGSVKSGTLFGRTFVEKSYNTYSYAYNSSTDTIAVETDVTNECGIKLAYFIDRLARIVSSFEKDGTSLKTLSLQKEKVCYKVVSGIGSINGNGIFNASNYSCVFDPIRFVKPDNVPVQKSVSFAYSFWLKLNKSYNLLEAQASYCKTSDTSAVTTTKVRVNPKAVGAWQKVTLSLILPQVTVSTNLYSVKISFLSDGAACGDTFQISDVGYIAAPTSELCLRKSNDDYLPLRALQKVKLNGVETAISKEFFLTEADIIATYTAKRSNSTFDVIHNDGTKRKANISSMDYYLLAAWANYTGNSPFRIDTTMPAKDAHCNSTYAFDQTMFSIENKFTKTVDGKEYSSSTTALMDYTGKTIIETDEYGVMTTNTYNSYGDLLTQRVGSLFKTYSLHKYSYDSEGRLESVSDGLTGQQLSYDRADNVKQIREMNNVSGSMQNTDHTYQNIIGVFQDKTVAAAECYGLNEITRNKITYEGGAIRTVSDGVAKYGVRRDLLNDYVYYSQFDGAEEKNVQRDSVTSYDSKSKTATKTHLSLFYNEGGGTKDTSSAKVDCYGNITQKVVADGTYSYTYKQGTESNFAKQISKTTNPDGSNIEYKYNDEKEVVGWKEKDSSSTLLEVQQIAENRTKFIFGNNDEEYFVETEHDIEKMAAPHLTSVIFEQDTNASNDRNATEIFRSEYSWNGRELTQVYDKMLCSDGTFADIAKTNYTYKSFQNNRLLENASFDNYGSDSSGRTTALDTLEYYDNGLLKQETFEHNSTWKILFVTVKSNSASSTRTYQYDNFHRLQKEINSNLGINRTFSYRADGRLSSIGGLAMTYNSRGQMTAYNGKQYSYDHYGNRVSKTVNGIKTNYTFKCGNILTKAGDTSYTYNVDGVRYKKVTNGKTTRYYLDGNKILGEDRPDCKLRYFYDATGLKMIRHMSNGNTKDYFCVKDSQGSIVLLVGRDRYIACRYEYDALGNCTILHDEIGFGTINPFRWKGFYFDTETGFYYANGSYYDPETMLYVDAQDISSVAEKAYDVRGLDRNGIVCDNILALASNPATVFAGTQLSPDYDYDPGKTWWEKITSAIHNWWCSIPPWKKAVAGAILIVAAVAMTTVTGGGAMGAGLLGRTSAAAMAAKAVLVELSIGVGFATLGWMINSSTSGDWNTGALENEVADSIFFTGVFMFVAASVNAIKYAARSTNVPIEADRYIGDVKIEKAQQSDFTPEAWKRIQSLTHSDEDTISSLKDGFLIHKGYRSGIYGKEYRVSSVGRFDFFDISKKTIYELKPNNSASIIRGINQLHRYNIGMGGGYKLVLVLY